MHDHVQVINDRIAHVEDTARRHHHLHVLEFIFGIRKVCITYGTENSILVTLIYPSVFLQLA